MTEPREPDPTDAPPPAEAEAAGPDRGGKAKKGKKARGGGAETPPPTSASTALPTDVRRTAVVAGHAALVGQTAWCGRSWVEGQRWRRIEAASSGLAGGTPPPHPTLDRSVFPDVAYTDTPVVVNGQTVVILRRERGYPSGPLPGDPSLLVAPVAGGSAICHVLAPAAARRCWAG